MLYSKRTRLEDKIVELSIQSPRSIRELHNELKIESVSERAVYKSINQLIEAGVLLKVGKRVWIDQEWIRGLKTFLAPSALPELSRGERLTYTFTSIEHLDSFWTTIVFQLEEYERDGQIFFYNFWAYVPERRGAEDAYYTHFAETKLHAFFVIGGDSRADMEFKSAYQDDYLQIDARSIPSFSRRDHITLIGDFVITVRLSKALSARIDDLYASQISMEELLPEITQAYRSRSNIRFVLENSPQKAKKLRKTLSKNFYFRMEH